MTMQTGKQQAATNKQSGTPARFRSIGSEALFGQALSAYAEASIAFERTQENTPEADAAQHVLSLTHDVLVGIVDAHCARG